MVSLIGAATVIGGLVLGVRLARDDACSRTSISPSATKACSSTTTARRRRSPGRSFIGRRRRPEGHPRAAPRRQGDAALACRAGRQGRRGAHRGGEAKSDARLLALHQSAARHAPTHASMWLSSSRSFTARPRRRRHGARCAGRPASAGEIQVASGPGRLRLVVARRQQLRAGAPHRLSLRRSRRDRYGGPARVRKRRRPRHHVPLARRHALRPPLEAAALCPPRVRPPARGAHAGRA